MSQKSKIYKKVINDIDFIPKNKYEWDFTLASLAYKIRSTISGKKEKLHEWASVLCLPISKRYFHIQNDALILWHGTSKERAKKMLTHGLFHKKGLWTTTRGAE